MLDVGSTRDNVKEAWGRCCSSLYRICLESRVTTDQCNLGKFGVHQNHQNTNAGILPVIDGKSSTYR